MTWLKIDDAFPGHPKVVGLSDRAFRLHITGLCHCSQHHTDGRIKKVVARQMGATARLLAELVDAGLWIEHQPEWEIHDFLDFNPSREKVEADRAAAAERKERWNASRTRSGTPTEQRPERPPRPDPARKGNGSVDSSSSRVPPSPRPSDGDGSHDTTIDEETRVRNVEMARAARESLRSAS